MRMKNINMQNFREPWLRRKVENHITTSVTNRNSITIQDPIQIEKKIPRQKTLDEYQYLENSENFHLSVDKNPFPSL